MLIPHSEVSTSGHIYLVKNPMSIECYGKVRFYDKYPYSNKAAIYPKAQVWFCKLRIVEKEDKDNRQLLLQMFSYIPGFQWEIVEKCANISWYDRMGGVLEWDEIPEVGSYLSQDDDEGAHTIILPYEFIVCEKQLVLTIEMRELLPECFIEGSEMPVEILSDYMRDRL